MKRETFLMLFKTIREIKEEKNKFEKNLEKLLGGDSTIITEMYNKQIEDMFKAFEIEFEVDKDIFEWLLYEVDMHKELHEEKQNEENFKELIFSIYEKEYDGTPENIYDYWIPHMKEDEKKSENNKDDKRTRK